MQAVRKAAAWRPGLAGAETRCWLWQVSSSYGWPACGDVRGGEPRGSDRHFREDHVVIRPLTVRDILDEHIARKLVRARDAENGMVDARPLTI